MKHPRYELRSITGYSMGAASGEGKLGTCYWVADTWNCYRECELWSIGGGSDYPCGTITTPRRSQAERTLARLNRVHDEWLEQCTPL